MSCEGYPVERPSFATISVAEAEAKTDAEELAAQAKADAEEEAQAVAQRIHFAKHYGEDFHGAIGDFFNLTPNEQEAFLQAFDNEVCSTTSASRIAKVLRDAAGITA